MGCAQVTQQQCSGKDGAPGESAVERVSATGHVEQEGGTQEREERGTEGRRGPCTCLGRPSPPPNGLTTPCHGR